MTKKGEQATAAADAKVGELVRELRPHAEDADYLLAFHAMLLSGLLGIISAQIGEGGAFALWDLVRKNGKVAMQFINADAVAAGAVKH